MPRNEKWTMGKKWEKTYYMETKQNATKKPMGQWGNQEGNLKNSWNKW